MKNLVFKSHKDFDLYLNSKEGVVEESKNIVKEIYSALKTKKKSVKTFSIELEDEDMSFIVSIAREDWGNALQTCLKHFEDNEMSDECIDTYMVIQKLKDLN